MYGNDSARELVKNLRIAQPAGVGESDQERFPQPLEGSARLPWVDVAARTRGSALRLALVGGTVLGRDMLRELLLGEDDVVVVGEADIVEGAPDRLAATRPDVVVIDIDGPNARPVQAVRRIRDISPGSALVVLSTYNNPTVIREMLELGVRSYLHKEIGWRDLAATIRKAAAAESVTLTVSPGAFGGRGGGLLSEREHEVLGLVAAAMSNRQIATRLSVTEGTVKRHLRNIFGKLRAVSRIDAVNKHREIVDAARPERSDRFVC